MMMMMMMVMMMSTFIAHDLVHSLECSLRSKGEGGGNRETIITIIFIIFFKDTWCSYS